MRGTSRFLSVLVVLATAAIGAGSTAPARATDGADRVPPGLQISVDDDDLLTGSFGRSAGPAVTFRAVRESTRAQIELTVDDIDITLMRDVSSGQATWSGSDTVMTEAAQTSLLALSTGLAQEWAAQATAGPLALPMLRDVLVRLVALVAEAPIGLVLADQVVDRPAETEPALPLPVVSPSAYLRDRPTSTGTEATLDECHLDVDMEAQALVVYAGRVAAPGACQQDDEDGIAYMSCATTSRTLWHDADSHCFQSERIWSGPDSDDCLGRCGPGCGLWGGGVYSYDCGEHDRCGRVHGGSVNPWDSECGDEYWEADDDFLWGWPNCPWG